MDDFLLLKITVNNITGTVCKINSSMFFYVRTATKHRRLLFLNPYPIGIFAILLLFYIVSYETQTRCSLFNIYWMCSYVCDFKSTYIKSLFIVHKRLNDITLLLSMWQYVNINIVDVLCRKTVPYARNIKDNAIVIFVIFFKKFTELQIYR